MRHGCKLLQLDLLACYSSLKHEGRRPADVHVPPEVALYSSGVIQEQNVTWLYFCVLLVSGSVMLNIFTCLQ